MKDWERFEYDCIEHYAKHHLRKDDASPCYVVHNSQFGEDMLRECGIISTVKKSRVAKNLSDIRKERVLNNGYVDYGVDAIAKHADGFFSALQMKLYKSKNNYLRASDLGTFMQVVLKLQRTNDIHAIKTQHPLPLTHHNGFLYCVEQTKIERYLHDCMHNTWPDTGMAHEKLKWSPRINDVNYVVDCVPTHHELRGYQKDAVEALCSPTCPAKSLLHMPCGTGKTLVVATVLGKLAYDVVVICSPLVISSQQNFARVCDAGVMTSHFKVLGDHEHHTSQAFFEETLRNHPKTFISTTYSTASRVFDALREVGVEKFCVVVDEAHNLSSASDTSCKGVWNMVDQADKAILVTATPPSTLLELKDVGVAYHMSFAEAIRQGVICDYRIWVPLCHSVHGDDMFPMEFNDFDGDKEVMGYVFFLVAGMLRAGCSRCICYMKSKKQCTEMKRILARVCKEYFGVKQQSSIIVEGTKHEDRKKAIQKFEMLGLGGEKRILLNFLISVRILDEAVDIPTCDSIFMASPGCTSGRSLARTMQRLYRAGRRHPLAKPSNTCHAFLWVDSREDCGNDGGVMSALHMLKEADPYLRDKIRVMTCDYEKTGNMSLVAMEEVDVREFCMRYKVDAVEVEWMPTVDVKVQMLALCDSKPLRRHKVDVPDHLVPLEHMERHENEKFQVDLGRFFNSVSNNWSEEKNKPVTTLSTSQKEVVENTSWFPGWKAKFLEVQKKNSVWKIPVDVKVQMLASCVSKPVEGHKVDVPDHLVPPEHMERHENEKFKVDLGRFFTNVRDNWSEEKDKKPVATLSTSQKDVVENTSWFPEWKAKFLEVQKKNSVWKIHVDVKVQMLALCNTKPLQRHTVDVPDHLVPPEHMERHENEKFKVRLGEFFNSVRNNWSEEKDKKPLTKLSNSQKAVVESAPWFSDWKVRR